MASIITVTSAIRWHIIVCVILFSSSTHTQLHAHDVVEQTTMLDGAFVRSIFHTFRDFTFRWVQSSSANRQHMTGKHLQELHHKQFPCDVSVRSSKVPDSVHRLRPGKTFFIKLRLILNYCFLYLKVTST